MSFYRLAVLGDPIEHSRSPEIHKAMLGIADLEGEYLKVKADVSVLEDTITGLRVGEWQGVNITMPLKAEAARLADQLGPSAAQTMSVNTLVVESGTITGHSTDTIAFRDLMALPEMDVASSVLVLGAGGSAAAALGAIDERPVYVAARRFERATSLCDRILGQPVKWGAVVAGALVINTTPVGMKGESLPDGVIEAARGVIDLPYGESPTPVVRRSVELGIPVRDGYEFLVRQAIDSFAMWTGARVDFEDLMQRLRNT